MEKYRLVQEHKAEGEQQPSSMAGAVGGAGDIVFQQQQHAPSSSSPTMPHHREQQQQQHPQQYHHYQQQQQFVPPQQPDDVGSNPQLSNAPEVRITQQGKPRNYISYAMNLFADGSSTIVLKAMGRAINKAVTIAEILKRKMPLHQLNSLSSVEMIDVYEPVEEGLDIVTSRRYVSCMMITLSLTEEMVDTNHSGYQPPLQGGGPVSAPPMGEASGSVPTEHHHHQHHHHQGGPGAGVSAVPVSAGMTTTSGLRQQQQQQHQQHHRRHHHQHQ